MESGLNPKKIQRCGICSVNIFDGMEHICVALDQRKAVFRTNSYVKTAKPLFDMQFNGDLHYINPFNGKFEMVYNNQQLLVPATHGSFSFQKCEGLCVAKYQTVSFKKFSIGIAVNTKNLWYLLYRVDISPCDGLNLIKIEPKRQSINGFTHDEELQLNTVAIFGVSALPVAIAMPNGGLTYIHTNDAAFDPSEESMVLSEVSIPFSDILWLLFINCNHKI